MIRNLFALLVMTIAITSLTMAQQESANHSFEPAWKQIDSLMDKGLPQSAAKVAQGILATAQAKKDSPNTIKAELFLISVGNTVQENAAISHIQRIDSIIGESTGAEKALWQSINAAYYWQYYQRNRWTILDRTPLVGTPPADIATWDAAAFIARASELYLASIIDREMLQAIPVERYAPLLVDGKNTRHLRPSLYDFLAFRAIEFFQNDEKDVIKPAYQFQIDGTLWFESAARLAEVKVNPVNPEALHFRALHTYQQLLAFHLHDKNPEALIDADLQRLAFVHQYAVHPQKDSLYLQALRLLEQRYSAVPAGAQVTYRKLEFLYNSRSNSSADTLDLPALKKQLDLLIERFPTAEGAVNAAQLRYELTSPSVGLQSESVILPDENSKVLVTYRNLNRAFLRIYRLPASQDSRRQGLSDEEQARLLKSKPLRTWDTDLPGAADLNEHRIELKIAPLPAGSYLLVISAKPEFGTDENALHAVPFQVSDASVIFQNTGQGNWLVALHRKSGMPLRGAQVIFWGNNWDSKTRKYEYSKLGQSRTDEDGKALITDSGIKSRQIDRISLVYNNDTLQTDGYFYVQNDSGNPEKFHRQTFLFTDRGIYRPGQTIYFKGILVAHDNQRKSNAVLANVKREVTLYDANDQKVTSLELTTNGFGSFSGKFTAPESGLTGQMRIADENGTVYFSVEEYKRPRFQVSFDTVKSAIALNDTVVFSGRAQAYAGNDISGAEVKYRVVRRARFPYFWAFRRWGQPRSPEMEITNGTVFTQADGSFEISFTTIPDKQIDPETLPVFTYSVYADVTDINGETQSGNQDVNAGYRSLQIQANVAEQLDVRKVHQLTVQTQNLNQVPVPTEVSISIVPLRFPGKLYRERRWEKPDQHLLSESEFRNAFPDDEYENEADYTYWPSEPSIYQATLNTAKQTVLELPASLWKKEGWHVIELKATDTRGGTVTEKKYIYASDPVASAKAQSAFSVNLQEHALRPGDTLSIAVKTGFDSTYVLESNTDVSPEFMTFSEFRQISRPITERDRGGLGFRWIYVRNNRVYTAEQQIDVPWSNRDLQLEWATHRDKLLPGAQEEWRLTITGDKKDIVAAEVVAGLYDASLDALKPHSWSWDKLSPNRYLNGYWNVQGFDVNYGSLWLNNLNGNRPQSYDKRYDRLFSYASVLYGRNLRLRGATRMATPEAVPVMEEQSLAEGIAGKASGIQASADAATAGYGETGDSVANQVGAPPAEAAETTVPARTNLQETAFFLPELTTDAEGNVSIRFTMPEALTEWKLMALAHTTDWKTGYLEGTVKTQKDLMVMPNLPRFLRQGDRVRISARISNISTAALDGVAQLTLLDATTLEPVQGFGQGVMQQDFTIAASQSTAVDWMLDVPNDYYTPVVVRITARAGNFTDGEENTLPVITNRMLVTETLPLPVRGNENRTFTLPKLLEGGSNTLTHHALTVEFTGNPAWYAVQALPYLMEYPYECAEQVFSRFYANA
ncbi:alpha-2-macroglobulin family protein, partial [Parapedobacter lycopersici]|uniref:alpha-2-macroglobulin family protein n=1 Tax=Parapedobacter lycopersici TaxID=1864939 RepID=UPI00333EB18A